MNLTKVFFDNSPIYHLPPPMSKTTLMIKMLGDDYSVKLFEKVRLGIMSESKALEEEDINSERLYLLDFEDLEYEFNENIGPEVM